MTENASETTTHSRIKKNPLPNGGRVKRKSKKSRLLITEEGMAHADMELLRRNASKKGGNSKVENVYKKELASKPDDFFIWKPSKALELLDFDYLHHHREQFNDRTRDLLQVVFNKIHFVNGAGKRGWFNTLEENVGWKEYITPIILSDAFVASQLSLCGIRKKGRPHNNRCKNVDLCPYCNWLGRVRLLHDAFSPRSGAFERAENWIFITVGFTTKPPVDVINEAWAEGYSANAVEYDPYPIPIGHTDVDYDLSAGALDEVRALTAVANRAVRVVREEGFLDGLKTKAEGDLKLCPWRSNRVNAHVHGVGNTNDRIDEIPEILQCAAGELLRNSTYCQYLRREYYPSINVQRINTPAELRRRLKYMEKVVPVDRIVGEALDRDEARREDGSLCPRYVEGLKGAIFRLVGEELPALWCNSLYTELTDKIQRRMTLGNMRFDERTNPIGKEPKWHRKERKKRAAYEKERRKRSRESQVS